MDDRQVAAPDSTAARVALWRAMHRLVDPPPHVLDDDIGLRLVAPDDGWRDRPDMDPDFTRPFRTAILARARFIEDLVVEQTPGGVGPALVVARRIPSRGGHAFASGEGSRRIASGGSLDPGPYGPPVASRPLFLGLQGALWSLTGVSFVAGRLLSLAFAWLLAPLTGVAFPALFLALSPGGMSGVSLVALALGVEPAFVTFHNVFRVFLILLAGPVVFRWARRRHGAGACPADR